MSLSILIASARYGGAYSTIASAIDELRPEDNIVVVLDNIEPCEDLKALAKEDSRITIKYEDGLGYWGHPIREKYQSAMSGDYIHNMDDDDLYISGWRNSIELAISNYAADVFCFRFKINGEFNRFTSSSGYVKRITGNVIIKNIPILTEAKWPNIIGGDSARYHNMARHSIKIVDICDNIFNKIDRK